MRHASLNLKDALAAAEKVYCCWRQRLLVHFVYQGGYHLRRQRVMRMVHGWQLGAMITGLGKKLGPRLSEIATRGQRESGGWIHAT